MYLSHGASSSSLLLTCVYHPDSHPTFPAIAPQHMPGASSSPSFAICNVVLRSPEWSPPPLLSPTLVSTLQFANMPLHTPHIGTMGMFVVMPLMLMCIDTTINILHMYILFTELAGILHGCRKRLKNIESENGLSSRKEVMKRFECKDDTLEHPHHKQVLDLVAWHIGVTDDNWYLKPKSTCWFGEYLFDIYTPCMFYDILHMKRTFNRLVLDLTYFIQTQSI